MFDFLAGLNRELDDVRGKIVARDPFPFHDDAFAEVRREEMRRKVMLQSDASLPTAEASDLLTGSSFLLGRRQGRRPWCDHCHRLGHTKDKCREIIGKPANWQPRKKPDSKGVKHIPFRSNPSPLALRLPSLNHRLSRLNNIASFYVTTLSIHEHLLLPDLVP